MAEAAAVREYAHQRGIGQKNRGRVTGEAIQAWNDSHPDDPYEPPPRDPQFLSAGQMDDLFPDGPAPEELMQESPPRPPRARPARTAARGAGSNWFGRRGGAKPGKSRDKKPPRVSTESFLGSVWRGMAKLAAPLPPLQRTLRIQAPVAGALLEDAVKGTLADTVLQPLARAAESGRVVQALVGPPLFVTAITLHAGRMAALDPPQPPNPLFMGMAVEGLRTSLMAWMEVAGDKFAAALEREREFEGKYGTRVDDFIEWLLSPPVDPADPAAVAAEQHMFNRAMGITDPAPAAF